MIFLVWLLIYVILRVVHADSEFTEFFYDLSKDDHESTNLIDSSEYSSIIESMRAHAFSYSIGESDAHFNAAKVKNAFTAANGYAPWETNHQSREIKQRYFPISPPHVVFLIVDDLGINELGYQSTYQKWISPFIDQLAGEGVKLGGYHTHEYCMPSRAALLTGRYGFRFGMQTTAAGKISTEDSQEHELPLSQVTLAEEFKSVGYHTILIGKWHMGCSSLAKYPTYRGFDYFYGYLDGAIDYLEKCSYMMTDCYLDYFENELHVSDVAALETYAPMDIQTKAIEAIKYHAENYEGTPMFMYYATPLTHSPYDEIPDDYLNRCYASPKSSLFLEKCAMIVMVNEFVQNISCVLQQYNMWDNTLFVFVSDNGALSEFAGANYPYRGQKFDLFRGSQTVTAFMHGNVIPEHIRGTKYNGLIHAVGTMYESLFFRCM
jgi:arylsulfatase I/J